VVDRITTRITSRTEGLPDGHAIDPLAGSQRRRLRPVVRGRAPAGRGDRVQSAGRLRARPAGRAAITTARARVHARAGRVAAAGSPWPRATCRSAISIQW